MNWVSLLMSAAHAIEQGTPVGDPGEAVSRGETTALGLGISAVMLNGFVFVVFGIIAAVLFIGWAKNRRRHSAT